MIAALYVQADGCYADIEGVDPWPESRDARLYDGPHPVVAHPPCARWCRLSGFVEKVYGHPRGSDGGCFASALAAVRRCGGVLEHPAYSAAWTAHGLMKPPTGGGWVNADFEGGWTCYVEQAKYGHIVKKATWLYAVGVELPTLRWGSSADQASENEVRWRVNRDVNGDGRRTLTAREAISTPPQFRDALLSMVRTAASRAA